jgi:membrane peptidoglycan carboxypeptidase
MRDAAGDAVTGGELPPPLRVLEPQTAYLVTSVLEGVLDRGTGAAARRQGVQGALAGKTGTTNGRRDNWFAGYSPDRATIVWVGYDDDAQSHLSGSSAALPIWSRFVAAVRPAAGYLEFAPPPGLVTATVDPTTGQLATAACPVVVTDLFPEMRAPREPCAQHPGGAMLAAADLGVGSQAGDPAGIEAGAPAGADPAADAADTAGDPAASPAAVASPSSATWKLRAAAVAAPAAGQATGQPATGTGTIAIGPTRHPTPAPTAPAAAPAPAMGTDDDPPPQPTDDGSAPPPA